MEQDVKMLNQIRKSTQMGQVGIRSVMKYAGKSAFQSALQQQFAEYDRIHTQADSLLRQHHGKPQDLPAMAKMGSQLSSYMQHKSDGSISKIAEMMIEGNTKGMIQSMRDIRSMQVLDPKIATLSDKLLETEQNNIEQMKQYL